MDKIKLAIAEDNLKYRKAIVRSLSLVPEFDFILLAKDGLDLLNQLESITPDIILMDIRMPEMDGITATNHVRELYPKIKIIAFSQYDFESNIIKMYINGVRSFVSKEESDTEIIRAIKSVHEVGVYMTERSLAIIQRNLTLLHKNPWKITLSNDESLIIDLMMEGKTSKQIGEKLNKSHRTIEDAREKLYEKLGVNNKLELISLAHKHK